MFRKIFFALLCGVIGTIFFAQFDQWTHRQIIKMCQKIAQESLCCRASFSIQSLNFFAPSLVMTDVEMHALNDDSWSWKCKKCTVYASWIQLLLKGVLERHVIVEDFVCSSALLENDLAINDHIIALMTGVALPFAVEQKSTVFKNAQCSLYDQEGRSFTLSFNSTSSVIGNRMQTMMSVYDGKINTQDGNYVSSISADLSFVTWLDKDVLLYTLSGSGVFNASHMNNEGLCYISGILESGRGRCSIRNAYNSLVIDPIVLTEREIRINGTFPLSYIIECLKGHNNYNAMGKVQSSVRIIRDGNNDIDGHIILEDCVLANHHISDVSKIIFTRRNHQWRAKLGVMRRNEECNGFVEWDEITQQGRCSVKNNTPLTSRSIAYWRVMPRNFTCDMWFNHGECIGIYHVNTENRLSKVQHNVSGGFSYAKGLCLLSGLLDKTHFELEATIIPTFALRRCLYVDHTKKPFLSLQQAEDDAKIINGIISFSFMREFIKTFFHYDLQGEGTFVIKGQILSDTISADIKLADAIIRLPETYNFIDGFHAYFKYNTNQRMLTCDDMSLSLFTGNVTCLKATALFDASGNMIFAHVPVIMNHCLLNIKKDLFAIVSGDILLSQKNGYNPSVIGNLIIDRAQLKENIFSGVIQRRLFDSTYNAFSLSDMPIECDISLETKSSIKVDTAFLQTNAKVDMRVQKHGKDPAVSGTITLQSGNLIFPYKPLFISKGTLTFSSEQLFDPAVELIARNKIKKYDVSLQVAGTLLHHHIMLDANPPISEEQIMTLLLVGSEESSLNGMIPALILQNLKNLIFANNQSTFLEKYFAPLLRPFNISLVPSFADQTGRGGLRGMLEISIDDRWRALIQKNFNLTEDTRFELEFLLSDDITLRGIRDERRDMGGEIEMRWKF